MVAFKDLESSFELKELEEHVVVLLMRSEPIMYEILALIHIQQSPANFAKLFLEYWTKSFVIWLNILG